ncbi:glycosyltransferase family 2 protein [Collinsella aerofaciens]|uniref:glycosyltransferase family 2 protein n=1 Tax=Collinsella aerofaciens TaxID=74426 RepID=UPI00136E2B1A|nr:glycosyltransferase family 2 protein [Collinsella aerofaciens]MZH76423.1 glycosyltransferase [Collinsella aerofaciens]MZI14565.1 glycosyltransferase [Collinsella aerofaciens]MZJ47394.1 glycosyltransferase [Collinsella aerofaciens]MZJ49138.1 glycosyltransferase [Collinsella aerofaciens]MZJ51090.1 glycosyltransferase [Collinsella aerofaciens]
MSKFQYDLSIIVPIYNTEFEYLEKCLESLRDISHLQFEAIMVDDSSQSEYSTALTELVSNETFPLRLIVKENGGQNSARELGLCVSHGRYLLFLDSDDFIDPLLLKRALDIAIDTEAQILTFNYERVTVDGIVIGEDAVWSAGGARQTTAEALLGLSALFMALFDVSFLRGLGFGLVQGTTIGEDFASVISFASKANRIVSFGEPVYKYVSRSSSLSYKPSRDACLSILDSFDVIRANVGEASE